ncbi:MAG: hypothetical protein RDV48_21650 [Candidatus Eremiobacteraeota bacterium]|nr:hypothetical protein [Candidatus Eremiobacteraeota bacterium]
MEKGRADSLREIGLKMKEKGLDAKTITEYTGLGEEEIEKL